MFTNATGTAVIEAGPKDGHGKCYICDSEVLVKKMREHVAHHILAAQSNVREPGKRLLTVSAEPNRSPSSSACAFLVLMAYNTTRLAIAHAASADGRAHVGSDFEDLRRCSCHGPTVRMLPSSA